MKPTDRGFVLSTGREFYAHGNILGLGPKKGERRLRITEGFDGDVSEDDYDYVNERASCEDAFTPAEREEIAAYMIELWKQWALQP